MLAEEAANTSEEELLTEPDELEGREPEAEASVAGAVAGVTTPLGTPSTHPKKGPRRKPKSPSHWLGVSSGNSSKKK
tara:strand:- start:1206 stop:1436 length:231 start_codon:yes stop_codon:yes gene_type:complete